MKKITFLLFSMLCFAFIWQSSAQSIINITTSGGQFPGEKWVSITTEVNGGGTQVWGQGNGTQCNGSGLINQNISLPPGTYYVNCYDQYDDSWDGTLISVTSYGNVIGNNGGLSPNDGADTDLLTSCEGTPAELEASFEIVVPVAPCTSAVVASSTIVPDCGSSQFSIDVDVNSVGDAIEVTDGTNTWPIVGTGIVNVGPFASGNSLSLSITHTNSVCDFSLGNFVYNCPPSNDECADAVALTVNADFNCGVFTSGTTAGATDSGIEPTFTVAGAPNNDVWYSFVAASTNHRITLTNVVAVVGTATDMGMAVFDGTGTCSSLVLVGSSDPNTYNVTGLIPGATYYVAVYGFATGAATAQTTFDICVGTPPPPPSNDNCANALVLTESSAGTCDNIVSGTTFSATASSEADCSTTNLDVWYTFTPSSTATYFFSVTETLDPSSASTYVSVFEGSCGALTQVGTACFSATTSVALTSGATYYVSVRSTSTVNGVNFDLCATTSSPNDNFADAAPIACGDNVTGNTTFASLDENNAPDGFGADMDAPNVWFVFDSSISGPADVTINMCPSAYDTSFLVYTGTSGNLTLVGGNDDGGIANCPGAGTRSYGSFVVDGVQSYYIAVEGFNVGSVGAFDLTLTCVAAAPAPANDECANAEALTFTVPTSGTTVGATQNGVEEQPTCDPFGSIADVWYSVVLASPGDLSVSTVITGTSTQANVAIYSACGGLQVNEEGCADGSGGEDLTVTGLAAGTYYIRVWSDGVAARTEGTFDIVADFTLSNPHINDQDVFTYYPNPVKNTLQLNAQSNIQNVSIYNMLGQEVLRTAPNNVNSTVDMSAFQTGAYFVKVTINDRTETIRVIKQ